MRALLLALVVLLVGCGACQKTPDQPPVVIVDASPGPDPAPPLEAGDECAQPGPADLCQAAGENICRLGCRKTDGTPLWKTPGTPAKPGVPLAETCRRWTADGRDVLPNGGSRARCLANINLCGMIDEACR